VENNQQIAQYNGFNSKFDPFYIPDYEPKSTSVKKFHDVDIFQCKLTTVDDQEVNILTRGKIYKVCYKIKFNADINHVNFSMVIQNQRGTRISGVTFPQKTESEPFHVKKNEIYSIHIPFKCSLIANTYFISLTSSFVKDNGERVPLIQINDILAFKIQKEKTSDLHFWGFVNLEQNPLIKRIQ
jgi:lipopolysaccharide transport system ATP-binding protein